MRMDYVEMTSAYLKSVSRFNAPTKKKKICLTDYLFDSETRETDDWQSTNDFINILPMKFSNSVQHNKDEQKPWQ